MAEIFHINHYVHIEDSNKKITKEEYAKLCSRKKKKYIASLVYKGPYYHYEFSDGVKISKEEQEKIQKGFTKIVMKPGYFDSYPTTTFSVKREE